MPWIPYSFQIPYQVPERIWHQRYSTPSPTTVDRQTPFKTLPSHNFVGGCNKKRIMFWMNHWIRFEFYDDLNFWQLPNVTFFKTFHAPLFDLDLRFSSGQKSEQDFKISSNQMFPLQGDPVRTNWLKQGQVELQKALKEGLKMGTAKNIILFIGTIVSLLSCS